MMTRMMEIMVNARTPTMERKIHMVMDVLSTLRTKCIVTMSSKKRLILTPKRCVVHVEVEHQEEMEMKMTRTMMKRMTKMLLQSQILTMMTKRRMMKIKTTETTKNSAKTPTKMSRMLLLVDANSLTCGQTCTVKKTLVKILNQRKCAADAVEEPRVVTVMKMKVTMMMKRMMMMACHQFQIQMMMMTKTKTMKITRTARTLTMAKKIHMVTDVHSIQKTKCIVMMTSEKRLISTLRRCAVHVVVELLEEMEMTTKKTMTITRQSQIQMMMTKTRTMMTTCQSQTQTMMKRTRMKIKMMTDNARTLTKELSIHMVMTVISTKKIKCTAMTSLMAATSTQKRCTALVEVDPRIVTMEMTRMMKMTKKMKKTRMMKMTKTMTTLVQFQTLMTMTKRRFLPLRSNFLTPSEIQKVNKIS